MEFLDFDFSSTGEHGDYMSWDEFRTSKGIQELVDHYNDTIDQIADQFETCTVVRCESANVSRLRQLGNANGGRAKGNDPEALATVQRNFQRGWNKSLVPPFSFEDNERINGAHRLWDLELKGCESCPTYRVVPKEGWTRDDVIDEVGLLYQPETPGTPAKFEDFAIRGINWWQNRRAKMDVEKILENWDRDNETIPQEIVKLVDEWVQRIAKRQTKETRNLLLSRILNSTEKKSFLVHFTRADAKNYCSPRGLPIKENKSKVTKNQVNRLISAMAPVHIHRDFLPQFFLDAKRNIVTVINFYCNVKHIDKASFVDDLCTDQLILLENYLRLINEVAGSKEDYTKYLKIGYRLPHVASADKDENGESQLVPLESPTGLLKSCTIELKQPSKEEPKKNQKKSNQEQEKGWGCFSTLRVLEENFEADEEFTFQEAREMIYPERIKVSDFKNDKSFRGTILREFQLLQDKGVLKLHADEGKKGVYSLV